MDGLTLQAYVRGSDEAATLYQNAFGAELENIHQNDDGTYYHVELKINGFKFALSESFFDESIKGNTMQFIFHFGEGMEAVVQKAYDVLKDEAQVLYPLGPCGWSSLMFGLIDKYGVNWCISI